MRLEQERATRGGSWPLSSASSERSGRAVLLRESLRKARPESGEGLTVREIQERKAKALLEAFYLLSVDEAVLTLNAFLREEKHDAA